MQIACTMHQMSRNKVSDVERKQLRNWIGAYERAWRTAGTDALADLWIVRLDDSGRCIAFEEWPFG